MVSLARAGILSTTLEAILYGFSVLMFIFTIWIMLKNRKRRQLNKGMLGASVALFVLSTAEMAVNIQRLQLGFLTVGPNLPGGPEQFFADISQRTFLAKSVLFNIQTLILDFGVIYRAYIVWKKNPYVIVLPVLGWLGLFAVSCGLNTSLGTASMASGSLFVVSGRWITANYSLTLATNLSATGLLAYRIWTVKKDSHRFLTGTTLGPLLRIVVESGAIYSVTVTAALITFVTKSNGVYVLLDMISPIISIVFNMIIVRVGLARESALVAPSGATTEAFSAPRQQYGQQSLAVEITQFIETDDGDSQRGDATTVPIELKPYADSKMEMDTIKA